MGEQGRKPGDTILCPSGHPLAGVQSVGTRSSGHGSGHLHRLGLRGEGELDGQEGVRLRHGVLRPVQAVQDELTEVGEADGPVDGQMVFALVIDQVDVVAGRIAGHIEILAELDVAVGAENHRAAVAPGAKAGGCEPIDAEVRRGAIVGDEPGITRDRLYGTTEWRGRQLRVIDTGGGTILRTVIPIRNASQLLMTAAPPAWTRELSLPTLKAAIFSA